MEHNQPSTFPSTDNCITFIIALTILFLILMGGPRFKKDEVESEGELHQLMMEDIEALEEGITILKNEFQCGDRGAADFLYVDSGNRLGVIEVKKDTSEDIVFQGLRYYDWVAKNRYAIANMFPDAKINTNEDPRLTLVAKTFSDNIRSLTTHFIPDIELFEYRILKTEDNIRGLYFHPISPPKIEETPTEPMTEKDLIDYMTDDNLRRIFKEKKKEIMDIHPAIKPRTTQNYLGFLYKGRFIAALYPLRKAFDIQAAKLDDDAHVIDYPWIRIEHGDEDYSSQTKLIKDAIQKLDKKT